MQSKAFLIAIAAFAVTATGVQAYGGSQVLARAGLSEQQIEAFEVARELRRAGEGEKARDVLLEAGVDESTLTAVQRAAREARQAMLQAVAAEDFAAFRAAIVDMPLADIITTEADFKLFVEAHRLRQQGDWSAAQDIFTDLGVGRAGGIVGAPAKHRAAHRPGLAAMADLTPEQHDALRVARQANDRVTMEAILEDAGMTAHTHRRGGRHW
jgi:hypothetical protein